MSSELTPRSDRDRPLIYRIRIKGHLSQQRTDWFEGLTITPEDSGETLLTGPVADQAALHGLLKRVRDLGIPLLSVVCLKAGPAQAESAKVNEAHQARSEEEN
jgi:hypothetical protein